ncbi:Vacuolar ATP synthase subunit C [Spraguea lophii 42_110]|uniref:Vacuolar ATP synthase subunit C n=1 Tax=Spraguea lophii (strain 42_110) TaxID=1358809 RepID=S7XSQ7_SPRLO|nr:Vacuolar ATP synthase subunit C [Spraguea lophii 42_110]
MIIFLFLYFFYFRGMTEFSFDKDFYVNLITALFFIFLSVPAFYGAAEGMIGVARGVCAAAEIKRDIVAGISACGFTTAPILFVFIVFAIFFKQQVTSLSLALKLLSAGTILGASAGFGAYACGAVTERSAVTKAQQKKFTVQFFVLFIFIEIIPLFGFIFSLLLAKS